MTTSQIDLNGDFYAINAGSPDGIPAVEMNQSTGLLQIMLFTSEDSARFYCYRQRQGLEAHIVHLGKVTFRGKVLQSDLIRIARVALKKYPQITQFIVDPSSRKGFALFISMKDLINGNQAPKTQKPNELINFLSEPTLEN